MENKLDQLKQIVAEAFANATQKQEIEGLAKINNAIEEVSKEQCELIARNAELLSSYKELVQHTSFQAESNATDEIAPAPVSFEDCLKEFFANKKK